MKKHFLLWSTVIVLGCSNASNEQQAAAEENPAQVEQHQHEEGTASLQLNNGAKWKADDLTRKNVAALTDVLNNKEYQIETNKDAFVKKFNGRLDTLVQECRMKGADHDALHLWLEKVIGDVKEVKEGSDYTRAYTALHKNVESFYTFFE
jgi:hypothetical protein